MTQPEDPSQLVLVTIDQGVASIVGLLSLAADFGRSDPTTERLAWTRPDGVASSAEVPTYRFVERIP